MKRTIKVPLSEPKDLEIIPTDKDIGHMMGYKRCKWDVLKMIKDLCKSYQGWYVEGSYILRTIEEKVMKL